MNSNPSIPPGHGRPVECVTFDLDDTLWPVMPAIRHAEARFYAWLREHAPQVCARFDPEALVADRAAFMRAAAPEERHDLTRLRKRWLRGLAQRCDACPDTLEEEGFAVFWHARNEVTPFPEAVPVLERLQGRVILGAISNGNADVFRTPLGRYFDFAVGAAEAGVAKPGAEIFALAGRRAGVPAHAILHVGDDAVADVVGAREAGMQAAWYNPGALPWEHPSPAPLRIGRLERVPRLLDNP
ncbi:HAD family hydrolase [Thioalkalivibrio sp. ALJ24]|uniref:HAD family hydrolase n=1 Tax=Thioalkalivibrio sp. ALJ24 TaxID=545276 RepID=UPI00036F6796|nr:HAD-IA family hydrolase [Thioalkalivibrio sp. ALJ24]